MSGWSGEVAPLAGPGPAVAAVETHTAVLLLTGTTVFKVKKPVRFAFLDYTTREQRLAACQREVELNRRLAPDVYLGVADIAGPDGQPWDHAVVMRRMPAERSLARLVAGTGAGAPLGPDRPGAPAPPDGSVEFGAGLDVVAQVREVARVVAAFHARAERGPAIDAAASPEAIRGLWTENLAEMALLAGSVFEPDRLARVEALALAFVDGRHPLLDERVAGGAACDGHGDLQAADIFCLDDGPRILDTIEFADRYRWGDVAGDIAFLAMDLERLGAPELAHELVDAYQDSAGAELPPTLVDHYIAYRALVRAKVAALRAAQETDPGLAASDRSQAVSLLERSIGHLERAEVHLVVVGGLPGTGKSTLAAGLAAQLDAELVRSDVVRKERAGLDPGHPAAAALDSGLYSPARTDDTYQALLARAQHHLALGRSVVLDASWTDVRHRLEARRLAQETASGLTELSCQLDPATAEARLVARQAAGSDASDAGPVVARALAGRADPWPEAVSLDTRPDPATVVAEALAALGDGAVSRSDR